MDGYVVTAKRPRTSVTSPVRPKPSASLYGVKGKPPKFTVGQHVTLRLKGTVDRLSQDQDGFSIGLELDKTQDLEQQIAHAKGVD